MARRSARCGVADPAGARSSEWLVWWSSSASDVYVAARTLGGILKVSLHESGKCHVRAPDPKKWLSGGEPPRFLDTWSIDPGSQYECPCGVIIPTSELRPGPWSKHKDKGTQWLTAQPDAAIEIGLFLTRVDPLPLSQLRSAGWHTSGRVTEGSNVRLLLLANNERGTRRFVEAAL